MSQPGGQWQFGVDERGKECLNLQTMKTKRNRIQIWLLCGTILQTATNAQAQNLFVSAGGGNILEYTPGGSQSTFASSYGYPQNAYPEGLAFDNAGNLFVADELEGNILEFTPGGQETTFASGLNGPIGLAFQDESLTTPEPSALGLMTVGVILLFVRCRCRGTAAMSQ